MLSCVSLSRRQSVGENTQLSPRAQRFRLATRRFPPTRAKLENTTSADPALYRSAEVFRGPRQRGSKHTRGKPLQTSRSRKPSHHCGFFHREFKGVPAHFLMSRPAQTAVVRTISPGCEEAGPRQGLPTAHVNSKPKLAMTAASVEANTSRSLFPWHIGSLWRNNLLSHPRQQPKTSCLPVRRPTPQCLASGSLQAFCLVLPCFRRCSIQPALTPRFPPRRILHFHG